ncbi:hypothetical protein KM043_013138 [Ampulex compressa]|nr:hypothetical protein KM043_013138 [Ampulex compressa]
MKETAEGPGRRVVAKGLKRRDKCRATKGHPAGDAHDSFSEVVHFFIIYSVGTRPRGVAGAGAEGKGLLFTCRTMPGLEKAGAARAEKAKVRRSSLASDSGPHPRQESCARRRLARTVSPCRKLAGFRAAARTSSTNHEARHAALEGGRVIWRTVR